MADENEFGGATEVAEEELGEGMHQIDPDAVDAVIDDVDDVDVPVDEVDPLLAKANPLDDEDEAAKSEEEGLDPEEEMYFYGDRYEEM